MGLWDVKKHAPPDVVPLRPPAVLPGLVNNLPQSALRMAYGSVTDCLHLSRSDL